jgi:hypothetical protein
MERARVWSTCLALLGVVGLSAGPVAAFDRGVESSLLARAQEHIAECEYWASPSGSGLQAPNRRQDLRTWFEPTGVRIHSRTAPGGPRLVDLRLARLGRGEALLPVGPGALESHEGRVEIRREGLVEWYRNSPEGLEQGFFLAERPAKSAERALVLELVIAGASASLRGEQVVLESAAGRQLTYGALVVRDANGAQVPARFAIPSPHCIRLVVKDARSHYPLMIDPLVTAVPNTLLESNQANVWMGYSVAGAGDVNDDGYADVIVGVPYYDAGQPGEGAAFVFLGRANGILNGNPTTASARLESNQADAQMGWSVAGAGDVNGDGYADVIVGAHLYTAGQFQEGAAFVFLGSATGVANGNPATAAARLESNQENVPRMGFSVAGAGDVNNDGYADVIVGAPYFDVTAFNREGAAFVFLGGPGGTGNGNPANADARLNGDQPNTFMGWSVASAGDVNGDHYADVIVGATHYSALEFAEGAAFVFRGSASGIASGSPATASAQLESNQNDAHLGFSVAGAGDVNNDGYADVIVGAPLYDAGQTDEGAAFVFLGGVSGVATTASARLESNQGGAISAQMGNSVAGAGDVNNDGYADVIVGAPGYNAGQAGEGAAFVFLGGASGIANGSPATASAQLESNQIDAQMGWSVAGAGSVNGDGYADVIVGAYLYNAGQADEGAAFIYHAAGLPVSVGPMPVAAALRAWPNPFSNAIRIEGSTSLAPAARATVFDLRGRMVRDLGAPRGAGWTWDGRDGSGRECGAGVFFARVTGTGMALRIAHIR